MHTTMAGIEDRPLTDRPLRNAISARTRFALAGVVVAAAIAALAAVLGAVTGLGAGTSSFLAAALVLTVVGHRIGIRIAALEKHSLEDPVTRVGNRRLGEEELAVEVGRAVRSNMPLSLMLLDVDNLKKLNDAHGHACGDRALALVGEVLRETCRSRDVPARFGGDEFAVVLPRTRSGEAQVVAQRIRTALARRRAEIGGPIAKLLTVSIGIADFESIGERRASDLVQGADEALYLAKSSGRDRVEVKRPPRVSGVIDLAEVRATKKSRAFKL